MLYIFSERKNNNIKSEFDLVMMIYARKTDKWLWFWDKQTLFLSVYMNLNGLRVEKKKK